MVVLLVSAGIAGAFHFAGRGYWQKLELFALSISVSRVALAIAITYACFWLRAARWQMLLPDRRSVNLRNIYSAQMIGFASVSLFGRVADLMRPIIIARRSRTPVATQMAVYSIERAFDLGAAATLFSLTLLFAPRDMPHHAVLVRAGILSTAAAVFLGLVVAVLHFGGDRLLDRLIRPVTTLSPRIGPRVRERCEDVRHGLSTVSNFRTLLGSATVSVVMWAGIAVGYLESVRAFQDAPGLANFSLTATVILLAAGIGGSLLQLPVLGWFTQIGVVATMLHEFFNVPVAVASGCGFIVLLTTSLCILPAGILIAQRQGITLRPERTR